jgi:hypothetical protein
MYTQAGDPPQSQGGSMGLRQRKDTGESSRSLGLGGHA